MTHERQSASQANVGEELSPHREVVENSLLRGGLTDVTRVIAASASVSAAAACIAALVALLY